MDPMGIPSPADLGKLCFRFRTEKGRQQRGAAERPPKWTVFYVLLWTKEIVHHYLIGGLSHIIPLFKGFQPSFWCRFLHHPQTFCSRETDFSTFLGGAAAPAVTHLLNQSHSLTKLTGLKHVETRGILTITCWFVFTQSPKTKANQESSSHTYMVRNMLKTSTKQMDKRKTVGESLLIQHA